MKIFNGKKLADQILQETGAAVKKAKLRPVLAVVLAGDDEASKLYVKLKKEAGQKIGVEVREFVFSAETEEEKIISRIEELNRDAEISGIIVQLPLPTIFNTDKIIAAVSPAKDVDGFTEQNRRSLEKDKEPFFLPVLPASVLTALISAGKALKCDLAKKNILALVNSEIFGETLKLVLAKDGMKAEYLVRQTCVVSGAEKKIKTADILISVCGCPNHLKAEDIKESAILIDAGVTRYHDGKVVGDIDQESVRNKAAFLTPVPGGLGPLTVALLLRNVYLAATKNS